MRLRSFHGDSLNDAMSQVREALGSNAVIVATRDDEQGGVRVTAALDDGPPANPFPYKTAPKAEAVKESLPAAEIEYDVVELAAEQMLRHAVPSALAEQILGIATHFADHDALIALGAAMDKLFTFSQLFDARSARPVCLVGPPGAGKTLCAAKIAAYRVMSKKTIGIITTDVTRAGAVEQLAAYTRLLKLRLFEVDGAEQLKDAIGSHKATDSIIVDSAGRNPFNPAEMADLKKLLAAGTMEPVIVLPGGIDMFEAADMVRAFQDLGAKRAILTKIDLSRRMGALLGAVHETGLHLCEMSVSAKVTDPLQTLNAVTLARLLLPKEIVAQALRKASA